MAKVAVDFGTANTVIAQYNETLDRPETISIPGISTEMSYRMDPNATEDTKVSVIPSLIYYGEKETLIGEQVRSRNLVEDQATFKGMKRYVGMPVRIRRTPQGNKDMVSAATDFLILCLQYSSDRLNLSQDEFTFCVPTESFERYEEWILGVAEKCGIRRIRIIDEPTASIFGYQTTARPSDRFLVFDFGAGTLDVSVVRLDTSRAAEGPRAVHLARAGDNNLGGMDIDIWIADEFIRKNSIDSITAKALQNAILYRAEEAKKQLCDPKNRDSTMSVINTSTAVPRPLRLELSRHQCPECQCHCNDECCFCRLLKEHRFTDRIKDTVERALEDAAIKAGVRKSDITAALVTGGCSLVPCARKVVNDIFGDRVFFQRPFDAVALGACRGIVEPILQHDYAVEGFDPKNNEYYFHILFKAGTEYPVEKPVKLFCKGVFDGMTRIGIKVYEVSRMKRHTVNAVSMFDERGNIRSQDESRVKTDCAHVCLNATNPPFIAADPPVVLKRDKERFPCEFRVDDQRRLTITVCDTLTGKQLFDRYPVVRL